MFAIVALLFISIILFVICKSYFRHAKNINQEHEKIWGAINDNVKHTSKIAEEVKKILSIQEYDRGLFDHHFTVTDKTILEERKGKQFWKKKALELEKKLATIKR